MFLGHSIDGWRIENGGKGVEGAEGGAESMKKMNGKLKVREIGGVQNQGGLSPCLKIFFGFSLETRRR